MESFSIKRLMLVISLIILSFPVLADRFRLQDIQIEGLERISCQLKWVMS